MENQNRARTRVFGVLTIGVATLLAILIAEWGLRFFDGSVSGSESMDSGFILYDSRYGWKLNPGWEGEHRHHDFEVSYKVNPLGFRGPARALTAEQNVFFLGDSFTFGLGVDEGETFVDVLNSATSSGKPTFSNIGIPGYATDQQLLLLEDIVRYGPDSVVWVVYLGNDLLDNRYPFPLQAEYAKPFFRLENGRLVSENSPVPRQSKSGDYRKITVESAIVGDFDPYAPWQHLLRGSRIGQRVNSLVGIDEEGLSGYLEPVIREDIELFMAMIDRAEAMLGQGKDSLSFVLLPGKGYFAKGSVPAIYQSNLESLLGETLRSEGFEVILPSEELSEARGSEQPVYHPNEGHLTPFGHQVVADHLEAVAPW